MKHACLITCAVLLVTSVHLSFAQSSSKVPVEFYAEALCPYCANFTITHLSQLFRNGLSNVVELDYIPFGNARYDQSTGNITCQHGRQECELNKVIGCALEAYPQQDEWFRFLECVEAQVLKDAAFPVERTTSLCAVKAGIRPDKVLDCYKGNTLFHTLLTSLMPCQSLAVRLRVLRYWVQQPVVRAQDIYVRHACCPVCSIPFPRLTCGLGCVQGQHTAYHRAA